jgi:hypothetical protein
MRFSPKYHLLDTFKLQQVDCSGEMTLLGCCFLALILPKGWHKTRLETVSGFVFL